LGFTSTTLEKNEAFKFLFGKLKKDEVPVLFSIKNLTEDGYDYFKLDSDKYS